jgi:hypothetical protein
MSGKMIVAGIYFVNTGLRHPANKSLFRIMLMIRIYKRSAADSIAYAELS